MKATQFFEALFQDYTRIAPQAGQILASVEERFGEVQNDHVAFRTFSLEPIRGSELEDAFFDMGYTRHRPYAVPDKHLSAFSYVPRSAEDPLIFLSEFDVATLPPHLERWVENAISVVRDKNLSPMELLRCGRMWSMPDYQTYRELEKHSPYAAWLSVWGLCANHFTIALHNLPTTPSLEDVVAHVQAQGWTMNTEGGLYKGTPADLLEQASTMAELLDVTFSDGSVHAVPSCYYEFARRYPDASGEFYKGFVPQSATHIFESTTHRKDTALLDELPKRSA